MSRKPSQIVTISGKQYRLTPIDDRAEEQRRAWDSDHLRTVSTRIPADAAAALERMCRDRRTTPYAWLRGQILAVLGPEIVAESQRRAWIHDRQVYGGMIHGRSR